MSPGNRHHLPSIFTLMLAITPPTLASQPDATVQPRQMEWLDRGLVALETREGVYLSWRVLGTDGDDIGFNLYRNETKITDLAITKTSNHLDTEGRAGDRYAVEVVSKDQPLERSKEVEPWRLKAPSHPGTTGKKKPAVAYKEIPLTKPSDKHVPGDMSVGDLDGDGDYELVFEWEGTPSYLEAIDLDGKRLWRVACGPNVSKNKLSFLVYDFDGDGKAEVTSMTAPGSRDGTGKYLCCGPAARDDDQVVLKRKSGRLIEDPSYITVFKGSTGEELATTPYWPPIGPLDEMEKNWGDNYGHRASSIKAAAIHHKDLGPLIVYARGIYSRIAMGAYRWDGKTLQPVWTFDSEDPAHPEYRAYRGQGNHSLAVGDVDADGSDEITYGACAIDHDGKGLYSTGMGHGDSHALGDLIPDRPGLEFFQGHENRRNGITMRDAATGKVIWEVPSKADVGRAWAADVSANFRGAECTSIASPNLDCRGKEIDTKYNCYFQPIYFDGDVQQELRNRTNIELGPSGRILEGWHHEAATIHSSKEDANLVADILGDWREEVIFRRSDNNALILFTTWIPTERKNYTLMHDPVYRMNIVVQNIGYNQPAHPGFFFADGSPRPNIRLVKSSALQR